MKVFLLTAMFFICPSASTRTEITRPNIIFLLADDMGFNDVSYHGSPQIPTPNIDALAASGIVFQNYYTAPLCTPSRGALLTGMYPIHIGLQHFVINSGAPFGLPLDLKIMPQHFKRLGYATHGIGKWHLGYFKKEYTPTYRGFDSYFGYWNGLIDYYDYTNYETVANVSGIQEMWGIDLHNGTEIVKDIRGLYATDLFTEKATSIIKNHNKTEPLFLYVSHLACHTGNPYQRLQAPPDYVAKFSYIGDMGRRTYAGVVGKLDESVGKIFATLNEENMLKNSIIIFSSDNGAEPEGTRGGHGSNWPLRSMKFHLWEGGVRVPALLWSPLLNLKEPRIATELMHISDWLPTLYRAAGGDPKDLGKIDGHDMWEEIVTMKPLPRKEILLNIDPVLRMFALIIENYKLILEPLGYPSTKNMWYGPCGRDELEISSMDEWVWKNGTIIKDILVENGKWLIQKPDLWRRHLTVSCGNWHIRKHNPPPNGIGLYDLQADPCELEDVADLFPEKVEFMLRRIAEYNATAVPPLNKPVDPHADPKCHGFAVVSWLDQEHKSDCPYFEEKRELRP